MKKLLLALVIVLVLMGTAGTFLFIRSYSPQVAKPHAAAMPGPGPAGTADVKMTAMAQATATAQANVVLYDRLDHNINNWLTTPPDVYAFKDGAYHITNREDNGRATVLQSGNFTGQLGYTLTMQEINGDDTSSNNLFGMIFRFSQRTTGNKTVTTFYSFEVLNINNGGQYQFWKYDNSGDKNNAWMQIWHGDVGNEFHQGHGSKAVNTFKVLMNDNNFTFTVNGKMVKAAQDKSFTSGTVGMIVNLNKTEVAFKDLLLTHN